MNNQQEFIDFLTHIHRGGALGNYRTADRDRFSNGNTEWFDTSNIPAPPEQPTNVHMYHSIAPSNTKHEGNKRISKNDVTALNHFFIDMDEGPIHDNILFWQKNIDEILLATDELPDPKYASGRIIRQDATRYKLDDYLPPSYWDKTSIITYLKSLPQHPSRILDSGGGIQANWLFDEPFPIKTADDLAFIDKQLKRWIAYIAGDTSVSDLARVLRNPNTLNYKLEYSPDYPEAVVLHQDMTQLYSLQELIDTIPVEDEKQTITVVHPPTVDSELDSSSGMIIRRNFWADTLLDNIFSDLSVAEGEDRHTATFHCGLRIGNLQAGGGAGTNQVYESLRSRLSRASTDNGYLSKYPLNELYRVMDNGVTDGLQNEPTYPPDWMYVGYVDPSKNGTRNETYIKPAEKKEGLKYVINPELDTGHPHTELANARRLINVYGEDLKFINSKNGKWFVYSGGKWEESRHGYIEQCAATIPLAIMQEAEELSDEPFDDNARTHKSPKTERIAHSVKSESHKEQSNMIKLAQTMYGIISTPDDFDVLETSMYLLNCANGTINLKTGELLPHSREDMITMQSPVTYDPRALCPTWNDFILDIMENDPEMVQYLQRVVGYMSTSDISEQALFYFHGQGGNGKSTFVGVIYALLASYAVKVKNDMILDKYNKSNISVDLYSTRNTRLAWVEEIGSGQTLDETAINDFTGGDPLAGRTLYEENSNWEPTAKLVLYGNDKPSINSNNPGIWRRMQVCLFNRMYEAGEELQPDTRLKRKLLAELPGILAWTVRGCLIWQDNGLAPPKKILDATAEYRSEMDIVGKFLMDETIVSPNGTISLGDMHQAYSEFITKSGEGEALSKTKFGKRLEAQHKVSKRKTMQGWVWEGLLLANKKPKVGPQKIP